MKIKNGFILREVAGAYVVIGVGEEAVEFNGMITTNETGAFLWNLLSDERTEEELVDEMLKEYDVEREIAAKDVAAFVTELKKGDLLA